MKQKNSTVEEKQLVAIQAGQQPKTLVQGVAFAWKAFQWCDEQHYLHGSQELAGLQRLRDTLTQACIEQAMGEWNPKLLNDLAREMRRFPKKWQPEKLDWFLLEASKQGPINLSELHRTLEANKSVFCDLKTFRRRSKKLRLKKRSAGRPVN